MPLIHYSADLSRMTIEETIHIDVPPDVVWSVREDVARWPQWTPTVTAARRLDPAGMLRIVILIFLVIVVLPVERGEAQPGDSTRGIEYWISGSVGTGTAGLTGAAAGTVDIFPGHLVTGRVAVSREIRFGLLDRTSPHEQTWEVGLLYGRPLGLGRIGRVTAAAGVGVVGGVRRGAYIRTEREVRSEGTKITPPLIVRTDVYERNSLLTIGMPLEFAFAFRPISFLGIGVVGFANLNRIEPFAGAAIQVQLGSWR